MARSTRGRRRSSTGSFSHADVSQKRGSTSSKQSGLDADSRGILPGLQAGEGNQEEDRKEQSKTTPRTGKETGSNASRNEGFIGEINRQVVSETDQIRVTKLDIGNGYLINQEYLQYEPLTDRKVITHVTSVFMPK
ncbi:hypothetical protein [uncultured Mediterranean phage uvMED]|nr:hypothetical protein [uncultured Mediterranean phage uvMED]